jgi:hypothetical protein
LQGEKLKRAGAMLKLRAIALILVLTLISGCDLEDRIRKLEKQNADLKAQTDKDHVGRDYDLKAKCSKDARTWFNENWEREKNTLLLQYSNHYQTRSNDCFILVELHYSNDDRGSWTNGVMLWNVYENLRVGNFTEAHKVDAKGQSQDEVVTCEMANKECTSFDQYMGLTEPYLDN